jgi:hypothetical protein
MPCWPDLEFEGVAEQSFRDFIDRQIEATH